MREDEKLQRHRIAEGRMQDLAKRIDKRLPEGILFALVTFTAGEGGYAGYVSNGHRADMIKALRECADILEAKADMPPGAPLARH